MNKHLKIIIGGLLILAGCKQAITIPDQDYLVTMGAISSCWRDNNAAIQCNCAVEQVRKDYPYAGALSLALQDPAQKNQAQARIQDALTRCGQTPQPSPTPN